MEAHIPPFSSPTGTFQPPLRRGKSVRLQLSTKTLPSTCDKPSLPAAARYLYLETRRPRITQAILRRGRRRQRRGPVVARAVEAKLCVPVNGARVLNAVPAAALAVLIPARTLRFALTATPTPTSSSVCVVRGGASARRSAAPSPESVRAGGAIGIGPRQSFGYIPAWGELWQPFWNHAEGGNKAERFSFGKVRNQAHRMKGGELSLLVEDGVPRGVGWNGGLWQREEGGEGAGASVASKVGDAGGVEGSKPGGKKGLVLHVDTPGFIEKSQAGVEEEEGERMELELEKVAARKEDTGAGAARLLHDDLISIMSNGSVRSTASPEPRDAARESAPNSEVGVGDPQPATSTQDYAGMDLEADPEAALNAELFGESNSKEEEKEGDGEEASQLKDFPQEQVHDEEQWGDCATAEDYWQQFEHEPTPVDEMTPRELQDEDVVMDDDDSPARTRQHSEQPQEVDAKDWDDHATEQAYWQQFEHNDKGHIPQLHVHGGEEAADASDREEWGDYQTSDDYCAQFDKPSRKFVDSYHERHSRLGLKCKFTKARSFKAPTSCVAGRGGPPTPPPSRHIPSNARADEQRVCKTRPPTLKSPDEASIWETIDAIIFSATLTKEYTAWSKACTAFFADQTARLPFPSPRQFVTGACTRMRGCVKGVRLGVCHHEIETLFRGSGLWSAKWSLKERPRWHPLWHPDRFSGGGEGHIEVQELAAEMFRLVQRLVDGFAKGEMKGR